MYKNKPYRIYKILEEMYNVKKSDIVLSYKLFEQIAYSFNKNKLNHILIEKGMTKKELAEKAGISQNTIQNIRNSKISFRNMVKIADALDVSLDEFRKDNT